MKQIMYIGPDIKGLVRKNQIFAFSPVKIIEKTVKVEPLAKYLFVDMDTITEKKRILREQGSLLNLAYKKIENKEGKHVQS